jgi:quinol monooxygenase YgiN
MHPPQRNQKEETRALAAQTVRVVARIVAHADRAHEMKALLLRIVEPTRAENGCIRYELHQSDTEPADFVFIEEWANTAAVASHMRTPHIQEVFEKAAAFLAAPPDIRRYHLIS